MEIMNRNKISITCPSCGKIFVDYVSQRRKFCSLICSHKAARKAERPDKKTLEELIAKRTITSIARKYKVSDNTIRRWATNYNIRWREIA